MDPYGKQELLNFYNRRLDRFGDRPQAVGWTAAGRAWRYGMLLDAAGDLAGKEVLDYGCGKADLYAFLQERRSGVRYCGIDVNENLIALARAKFPDAEFLSLDIEEQTCDRSFDVILICGVFNLRIAGIAESMRNALRRLFPLCREALHLNIPSADAPWQDIELFYADPEELLAFAVGELSPSASLRLAPAGDEIFLSVFRA